MQVWLGECHVHAGISPDRRPPRRWPPTRSAELLVHPECGCATSALWLAGPGRPAGRSARTSCPPVAWSTPPATMTARDGPGRHRDRHAAPAAQGQPAHDVPADERAGVLPLHEDDDPRAAAALPARGPRRGRRRRRRRRARPAGGRADDRDRRPRAAASERRDAGTAPSTCWSSARGGGRARRRCPRARAGRRRGVLLVAAGPAWGRAAAPAGPRVASPPPSAEPTTPARPRRRHRRRRRRAVRPDAAGRAVEEGPQRVADLLATGARFDRAADGRLSTSREGGHHRRRVVHAGGDATGAEVARALSAAGGRRPCGWWCRRRRHRAAPRRRQPRPPGHRRARPPARRGRPGARPGRRARHRRDRERLSPRAPTPTAVTGDGLALALRAGASLVDVEFVQFHPTALVTGSTRRPAATGHRGAAGRGRRPARRTRAARSWPAGTPWPTSRRATSSPARSTPCSRATARTACLAGRDRPRSGRAAPPVPDRGRRLCAGSASTPPLDPIPVASGASTSSAAASPPTAGARPTSPGCTPSARSAATGVHGANRLASNSLLEGLVFGRRAADAARARAARTGARGDRRRRPVVRAARPGLRRRPRDLLGSAGGLRRRGDRLDAARAELRAHVRADGIPAPSGWTVAAAVLAAAAVRAREPRLPLP